VLWDEFYACVWDWASSTRRVKISALKTVGPGEEVAEVVLDTDDEGVKAQLVRKAMRLGARFTAQDVALLESELPADLFEALAQYAGVDTDDLYFDETTMAWDDFYAFYMQWDEEILHRRLAKLNDFGPAEEVCDVIVNMYDPAAEQLLYKKALAAGVRFTAAQLELMGMVSTVPPVKMQADAAHKKRREKAAVRRVGIAAAIYGTLRGLMPKKRPDRCDGDCDNCPPHHGYRYGRWYYGHGHQWGCTRGGNGGHDGKTYRT